MQIYERIKKAREESGLTPEALAAKLGVARTTYLYWEESTPKPEKVMSVAKALGLPEYYFFIPGEDEKEDKTDEKIVNNSDTSGEPIVSEPGVEYLKNNTSDYLAGRLAEKDATIEQIEKRIQDALLFAQKMEQHYEDAKAEKAELFVALKETRQTINELLNPMAISLKDIPPVLDVIVRNSNEHDKEIMKALDHLVGNQPGTLEKESGKRILKGALEQQKKGKADVGKQD